MLLSLLERAFLSVLFVNPVFFEVQEFGHVPMPVLALCYCAIGARAARPEIPIN